MVKTARWAMGLVFLSTLFSASGQILIKTGVNNTGLELVSVVTNIPLIIGYCLYGLSAAVLVVSLKYGELSVLYPIYAMNFIWVAIMSPMIFATDSMNTLKWAGIFSVVMGVILIGYGSGGKKND
jgi:multidrug transporter EmrE-like cation transporter